MPGTDCHDVAIDRRDVLVGATVLAAGRASAGVAFGDDDAIKSPPTRVLDGPTVRHGKVTFESGGGEVDGYLAHPKAAETYPAVLVVAGNRITEEYIPNTCAALAVAGYVGLAPNVFNPVPANATPAEMNAILSKRSDDDYLS